MIICRICHSFSFETVRHIPHCTLLASAIASVFILPPQPAAADEASPRQLDAVQVVGRAQTLYKANDAAVATRTDTPLERVPQSVQVLPRELMDDQAARQVTDLYRSISGLSLYSYGTATLRGFRQDNVLYDGLRGDPYAGFSVPQLFNIDRVEVLKGPSGALFGGGDPGGVINYVTRKPSAQARRTLELQAGNAGFRSGALEGTGPVAGNDRVRYRAGIYSETEDGTRWNTDRDGVIADASLAVDVGRSGTVTLQLTDITQQLGGNRLRGVPVDDQGNFLGNRRWNHNEASDFLDMDAQVALLQYRASPGENWDVDVAARWFDNHEHQIYHEPMGLVDRDRDGVAEWMTRQLRNQIRDNDALTVAGNAVWRTRTGAIEHKVLMGADVYRTDALFRAQTANSADLARGAGPVPGIALRDPVYGLSSHHDYGLERLPWRHTSTRSDRYGVYLQDEAAIGERWLVLAGLRWDGFKDRDLLGGTSVDGHDLSWRLGTSVAVSDGVNVYANVAAGFMPQAAANQDRASGGPFDPERSRQWEVGMKSLLADRITLNMAAYRIERSNIVQATGEVVGGVNQLEALGLVRSKGMELDLLADLTAHWVLNLTYAYNDARVIEAGRNGITDAVGDRFANAPRNTLGLWTRHDLPSLDSAVGFGVEYMDDRISRDGQRVKPYTVFDLSWKTRWRQWDLQANVKNVFDKVYAASGFIERNGHFPGEPRRVYLQATYRW